MKNVSLLCGFFISIMTIHKAHSGAQAEAELLKDLKPLRLPESVFSEKKRKLDQQTAALAQKISQMKIEDRKSNNDKTSKPPSKK